MPDSRSPADTTTAIDGGTRTLAWRLSEADMSNGGFTGSTTTSFDDPIVQACIDNGGHYWPDDAPENEPPTCTRCLFNPGWKSGKPRNESNVRPIRDEPQA